MSHLAISVVSYCSHIVSRGCTWLYMKILRKFDFNYVIESNYTNAQQKQFKSLKVTFTIFQFITSCPHEKILDQQRFRVGDVFVFTRIFFLCRVSGCSHQTDCPGQRTIFFHLVIKCYELCSNTIWSKDKTIFATQFMV